MSNAERPLLIHCRSGADRTGLVSAFYVAGIAGGSELYAEFQLTPYFGHFPFEFMQLLRDGSVLRGASRRVSASRTPEPVLQETLPSK